jgi:hypothetical protein
MCDDPLKAANPTRLGDATASLVGFSRTMNDLSMVTEVIDDGPNARVIEHRIYRRAPSVATSPVGLSERLSAVANDGPVEFCQRCIYDKKTTITTCYQIPCPKPQPQQPQPQDPPKA